MRVGEVSFCRSFRISGRGEAQRERTRGQIELIYFSAS